MSRKLERQHSIKTATEFLSAKDRYKGRILNDTQIFGLLERSDPTNIESAVLWFGSGIPDLSVPFRRYETIMERSFGGLSKTTQEGILTNGARYVIGDFKKRINMISTGEEIADDLRIGTAEYISSRGKSSTTYRVVSERNLATLLSSMLHFTGGDLKAARTLISRLELDPDIDKGGFSVSCSFLYTSADLAPELRTQRYTRGLEVKNKYLIQSPQVAQLAFWMDVHTGRSGLNPKALTPGRRAMDLFTRIDNRVKVQLLIYLQDQLRARTFSPNNEGYVKVLTRRITPIYLALKDRNPDASFVKEYDKLVKIINENDSLDRFEGGKLTPDDLATVLEIRPAMIQDVSIAELELAINNTSDHGLSSRLNRLLEIRMAHST